MQNNTSNKKSTLVDSVVLIMLIITLKVIIYIKVANTYIPEDYFTFYCVVVFFTAEVLQLWLLTKLIYKIERHSKPLFVAVSVTNFIFLLTLIVHSEFRDDENNPDN